MKPSALSLISNRNIIQKESKKKREKKSLRREKIKFCKNGEIQAL